MKKILAVVMITIVVVIGIIAFLYAGQGMFHVDMESEIDLSTEQDAVSTDEIEEAYLLTERGTQLTDEEAENLYITDISDEDWDAIDDSIEGICLTIEEYSDEDGYVNPDDTDTVLNAVTEQVSKLYDDGIVTYYKCNSDVISFEFASGLTAYYEPMIEGYLAGVEEDFVNVITLDPWDKDIGSPWAAIWGANISVSLDNREILNLINDNESRGCDVRGFKESSRE